MISSLMGVMEDPKYSEKENLVKLGKPTNFKEHFPQAKNNIRLFIGF